jgi:hypothetical protein
MDTDKDQREDIDPVRQFRIGLAGLSKLEPADMPGRDYWADAASAMTRVIEAWSLIGPLVGSDVHGQAITKLIDDAMNAFACRDDAQLRLALSTAYSIWTTYEFTDQIKNTRGTTKPIFS